VTSNLAGDSRGAGVFISRFAAIDHLVPSCPARADAARPARAYQVTLSPSQEYGPPSSWRVFLIVPTDRIGRRSGLLGISAASDDMRLLRQAGSSDPAARPAPTSSAFRLVAVLVLPSEEDEQIARMSWRVLREAGGHAARIV
jgi:hypothetical protein